MNFIEINFEALAKKVGEVFLLKNLKLVTAESCTGGWVGAVITSQTKSSCWFERGFITYSCKAKEELLNIDAEIIKTHGAVSEETVTAMALGALKNSLADVSIAITGVAGPTGGNEKTPVGTIYFAFAYKNKIKSMCKHFTGEQRNDIRAKAVEFALQELIKFVAIIT